MFIEDSFVSLFVFLDNLVRFGVTRTLLVVKASLLMYVLAESRQRILSVFLKKCFTS